MCYSVYLVSEGERGENRPLGPSSGVASGSLGGSGMLQSVPAQEVLQVHVASLLHTCTDMTEMSKSFERKCWYCALHSQQPAKHWRFIAFCSSVQVFTYTQQHLYLVIE